MKRKRLNVLLIEDDPGDIDLAKSAIAMGGVQFDIMVVEDGVKASNFLHKKKPYENAPLPDLIILDFNLPRKNGPELLEEMAQNGNLSGIPLVVLSTSRVPDEITQRYKIYRDCCFVKPLRFDDYVRTFKKIEECYYSSNGFFQRNRA